MSEKLPGSLLWNEGGHLTEEALTAVADGEERLLPEDVSAHALACEKCARHVGEAAMLSASMSSLLASALSKAEESVAPASQQRSAPPFWALAFALLFAGVGAAPFLMEGMHGLAGEVVRTAIILRRVVPMFTHGAVSIAGSEGIVLERALVTLVSLAVLMMSLFAMSRLTPREGIVR